MKNNYIVFLNKVVPTFDTETSQYYNIWEDIETSIKEAHKSHIWNVNNKYLIILC